MQIGEGDLTDSVYSAPAVDIKTARLAMATTDNCNTRVNHLVIISDINPMPN